jgi:hypothetical protein
MENQKDNGFQPLFSHHKTFYNEKKILNELSNWNLRKLKNILSSLVNTGTIEIKGKYIFIYYIPPFRNYKEFKEKYMGLLCGVKYRDNYSVDQKELLSIIVMLSRYC